MIKAATDAIAGNNKGMLITSKGTRRAVQTARLLFVALWLWLTCLTRLLVLMCSPADS